jgi:hypothetical protein
MKSYKRMALISAVTLVCLGCLGAGNWLVFERPPEGRNSKTEIANSNVANGDWELAHRTSLTSSPNSVGSAGASATARAPLGWDSRPGTGTRRRVIEGYGRLPLSFEANAGRTDWRVKFLSRAPGYNLFLTGDEAVLALKKADARRQKSEARRSKIESATGIPRPLIRNLELPIRSSEPRTPSPESRASSVLRLKLLGAKPAAKVTGAEELPGKANYFIGNDPKKWRTNVPTYGKVKYKDVYPGVDLLYYGNQSGQLEYDFVLAPGADPSSIVFAVDVAGGVGSKQKAVDSDQCKIASNGDLVVRVGGDDEVRFQKPLVYQEKKSEAKNEIGGSGNRKSVQGRFVLDAQNRLHFALGPYDHTQPLVIDPTLVYSTYLGGNGFDQGNGIAADSSGNAYVVGQAYVDWDFPVTSGAYQTTEAPTEGNSDAFVAKLTWDASTSTLSLAYSTYLGGSLEDYGEGIAVDSSGYAYVTGYTASGDFPTTTGVYQATHPASGYDAAFVTKLNQAGSGLVYSTYLGGNRDDYGYGIAVDSTTGNAYVTGYTESSNFPTVYPIDQTVLEAGSSTTYSGSSLGGGRNAFVAELNSGATNLVYSTYLGGNLADIGYGIALDSSGNAYVTGKTASANFPIINPLTDQQVLENGSSTTYTGSSLATSATDAFVAELSFNTSTNILSLVYSTYLGVSSDTTNVGTGIAVDSSGNVYVVGYTNDSSFPTTSGAYQTNFGGEYDAFVAKLSWASTLSLVYSTYLGGSSYDHGYGIAVDSSTGNAYVTGNTDSSNFPVANPIDQTVLEDGVSTTYSGSSLTGSSDVFVAQLNSLGSGLVYSTYLGGTGEAVGYGIALDSSGNAYVTGILVSSNFPVVNPIDQNVLEDGSSTTYSGTTLGGEGANNAFVAQIGAPAVVDFSIRACSKPLTIRAGEKAICEITLKSLDDFKGGVKLSSSGEPAHSAWFFFPEHVWLEPSWTAHSIAFIATSWRTPKGTYALTFTGTLVRGGPGTPGVTRASTTVTLIVE